MFLLNMYTIRDDVILPGDFRPKFRRHGGRCKVSTLTLRLEILL